MVNALIVLLIGLYLLAIARFWSVWFAYFKRDTEAYLNEYNFAITIITLASILWVIVVPLAYLELLGKQQRQKTQVRVIAVAETIETSQFANSRHQVH